MPRVNLRTLSDPILMRLHRISKEMLGDEQPEEAVHWQQIVRATQQEIMRRGYRIEDVQHLAVLDAEPQSRILAAFRAERANRPRLAFTRNPTSWRDAN